jgi:hypothetical protein
MRGRGPAADWFDFYGENFGRDDMYVDLRGGATTGVQVPDLTPTG